MQDLYCASSRSAVATLAALLFTSVLAAPSLAQLSGQNMRGDTAISAGSLPDPGWSVNAFYSLYDIREVRDADGNEIVRGSQQTAETAALTAQWVSDEPMLLGARYSFLISPGIASTRLESPTLEDYDTDWGLADLYISPIALGWNLKRADYTIGLGVYAPTGRYDIDADDNTGLGAWAMELFAGGTWYLDSSKSWTFAAIAYWETFGDIEDSDQEIGDIVTVEGGLGKTIGNWSLGMAYFVQWKTSTDELALPIEPPVPIDEHRVYGLGPEVNWTLQRGGRNAASFTLRALRDFGARSMTEGDTLTLSVTFPF